MALEALCGWKDIPLNGMQKYNPTVNSDVDYFAGNFREQANLCLPPFAEPAEALKSFTTDETGKGLKLHFEHGTTTLGFQFQGGIIMAVDSRATGGQYIGSQFVKKIIEINEYLLGTMAGGAADCTYWERVLAKHCRIYELRNRERISVAAASKLLANIVYNYKGMGLSMGVMISGWDKKGPALYYVDSDGNRMKGDMFSVGSGSTYALGILDSGFKFDMTDAEAQELGRRAIAHATHRDAYSGGIVRVYHIKPTGWVHISDEDCMDLHYKYMQEKGITPT
jgi:20S proteasome subunit beta 5